MIIDYQNLFSNDQAITVSAASTNVIDLGNDSARVKALNEKGEIEFLAQVTTAFDGGTSIAVAVQSDDDEAFGSPTTVVTSAAVATASLVAGYQFKIAVAANLINEQYARLYYTVVGTMSAGKVLSAIVLDRQTA
jgi:hypothetical protein